ncbi:CPBP family intramembrane metalloprotease [Weissella ceti]|uniref:CPBP family intramembrane metalloprotease n=1 Tax=Weissella ceti TaxID=759620 RepID=A0ABT3E2U2_9LACO|nr:type II CAAX endopeptidase family protein [Weissella ceti]MCW0952721.1 CPBP family intramembrane metalloprotease [Weissella ceti]QVK12423.1 CPBP family intramembrane metalloprotease [Weissella ceti]
MTSKINWMTGLLWVVTGIILDFSIQIFGVTGSKTLAVLLGQPVNGLVATGLLVVIVAVLTVAVTKVLLYAVRQADPDLRLHTVTWEKLSYVFVGYLAIIFGLMFINLAREFVVGHIAIANNQLTLQNTFSQGIYGIVFVGFLAVVVAPIVEELIFRGIVLNYFFTNKGWWWNIVLSAAMFGYFHVYSAFNPFDFLQYALMGGVLAYVYKKTQQIQYAMLTHALNNAISFFAMLSML